MRRARRTECTKTEDCPARLHRAGCRRVYQQVLQIEQEKKKAICQHHGIFDVAFCDDHGAREPMILRCADCQTEWRVTR